MENNRKFIAISIAFKDNIISDEIVKDIISFIEDDLYKRYNREKTNTFKNKLKVFVMNEGIFLFDNEKLVIVWDVKKYGKFFKFLKINAVENKDKSINIKKVKFILDDKNIYFKDSNMKFSLIKKYNNISDVKEEGVILSDILNKVFDSEE